MCQCVMSTGSACKNVKTVLMQLLEPPLRSCNFYDEREKFRSFLCNVLVAEKHSRVKKLMECHILNASSILSI